jgi:hypothetical protein
MTTSGKSISQTRYEAIVAKAKARTDAGTYVEVHHILPRSMGGADTEDNLVRLTAREHFLAHWLLYRIYKTPAMARSFKLMVNDQARRRGRDYAAAREIMAHDMRGDRNVSRRPEVRKKLRENCYSAFAGKKRPEHAALMREKGLIRGDKNPGYGKGSLQAGALNHMARKVVGLHPWYGVFVWETATAAAQQLDVTLQAVVQAVRRSARSKGWRLEYVK